MWIHGMACLAACTTKVSFRGHKDEVVKSEIKYIQNRPYGKVWPRHYISSLCMCQKFIYIGQS